MIRKPVNDPRTVAREIPGVFDSIFTQLTPAVVAYFNRTAQLSCVTPVPVEIVQESGLQRAMLFELAFAVGECLLAKQDVDWDNCLWIAIRRQRRYFDARIPDTITTADRTIAEMVGNNMVSMLFELSRERGYPVQPSPFIPGFQWISSGRGDFAAGPTLIEVKCSSKNFSTSDYRQIVMYWLLSFAASVERNCAEWSEGILLNPRSAKYVLFQFDDLLRVIGAGRTKVEILQVFSSLVESRDIK